MFWSQSRRDMTPRTGCQSNIAVCLQMKDISTFQSEVMSIGRLSQLWDITGTANIYITSLISVWWQAGAGRSIVIGCQLQWSMWCIWHWWPWRHQGPGAGTRQWSHQTQMDGHQAVCDAMVCVTDQIVALHHIIGCDDVCLLWSIVWLCDVPCLITRKL